MRKVRWVVGVLILVLLPVVVAQAANPDGTLGHLRIEIIAAHNLVVDSNVTSPPTYAPKAATLGAKICNDGDKAIHDAHAYIGNYIDGSNDTPGTYPVVNSADGSRPTDWTSDFMNNTGTYSLTHESGSFTSDSDASRAWVGTLNPGECKTEYWIISYPQCVNVSDGAGGHVAQSPPCDESITGGVKGDDDLSLDYDVWANGYYDDDATPGKSASDSYLKADETRSLTLRNEISAAANKIWPNGDNKVPDEYKEAIQELLGWDTWTPTGGYGAFPYPGETVRTQGIWYDMGNVGAGFDNDNDGVPDKNAWMQPVGDPSLYDAGCFRLVRTYGIVIVKQQGGTEHLIPFEDQLYFEHIPDNTGAVGLVFYEYAALNGVCRGALSPYQEVASGNDNEKFAGDYGTAIQMETKEPLAFIAKNVFDDSMSPDPVLSGSAQILIYQIEVTNPNTYTSGGKGLIVPLGDPLVGTPVVTRDSIPNGTEYIAGSAKFIDNTPLGPIVPVTKSGKILYSTDNGISWSTTEPAANTITDIEWWLDEPLTSDDAAGGNTMKVEFKVNVPGTYPDPYVTNIGCAAFGTGPCFDENDAITLVNGTNQIVGDLWEDIGIGNDYGDGEKDAAETNGIIGVDVAVYYDTDNSGDYSEGDILWETVTTDGTGHYQTSTTLPNGEWVLVVGSLPSLGGYNGWANTTDVVHAVDGLTGGETRQAPDTGYAPALILDKDVHNPADDSRIDDEDAGFTAPININEGDTVKYTIDVSNTLYDPGAAPTCTRIVWADLAEQGSGTGVLGLTPSPGNISVSDDQYLQLPIGTQAESVIVSGFTGVEPAWGNITALETVLEINNDGYACTDHQVTIETDITYGAGSTNEVIPTSPAILDIDTLPNSDGSSGEGLWAYDILGARSIALSDLSSVSIEAKVKKKCTIHRI